MLNKEYFKSNSNNYSFFEWTARLQVLCPRQAIQKLNKVILELIWLSICSPCWAWQGPKLTQWRCGGSGIFVYIISDILTPIHRYSYLEGSSFPVSIMKRKIDFHGFQGSFKHFIQFRAIENSVIGMNSKNDKIVNLNFQKSWKQKFWCAFMLINVWEGMNHCVHF